MKEIALIVGYICSAAVIIFFFWMVGGHPGVH